MTIYGLPSAVTRVLNLHAFASACAITCVLYDVACITLACAITLIMLPASRHWQSLLTILCLENIE